MATRDLLCCERIIHNNEDGSLENTDFSEVPMSIPMDTALLYDGIPMETNIQDKHPGVGAEAEKVLAARAQTGDYAAFEELVRRYRNDVFALAYHFVRNREDAWDISQEVFIKAHRALRRFRGQAAFKTWLLRITANHCKDTFKKRRLQTVAFDETHPIENAASTARDPERTLADRELGQAIEAAVLALPEKHRMAFVLREYEGLSYHQMAQTMKCSVGTVMSRLHHARKKLRNSLIRMGVGEDYGHG